MLWNLLDILLTFLLACGEYIVAYALQHPVETGLGGLALLRLCGTTVQTGYKGVLFVFGRVRRELDPGFHPLMPVMMTVRKIPVRSITLDLPEQSLTTADGMVFDVQLNIVYRVTDPKLALTQIDNLHDGMAAFLSLIAEDLLRQRTRATILDSKPVEAELTARAEEKLRRWGVTVEHAGFKSIAPSKKTLRLTQLSVLCAERNNVLKEFLGGGVPVQAALALLGADRRLVGHSTARYRALHRHTHSAPIGSSAEPVVPLTGDEPATLFSAMKAAQQTAERGGDSQMVDVNLSLKVAQPPLTPTKKTTKGVEPRGWRRLQTRLRRPEANVLPVGLTTLADLTLPAESANPPWEKPA